MDLTARIVAGEEQDMTDREELEFAAKAAGLRVGFEPNRVERGRYDLYWSHVHHRLCWHGKTAGSEYPVPVFWNPRDDDGDALRLAVKLRIGVLHRSSGIEAHTFRSCLIICNEECAEGFDYYAATRRAIFRVAVEIGRSMV